MKPTTDAPERVDMQALLRALPVSTLEPNTVATLGGFSKSLKDDGTVRESIKLLEPPASERVPYIEPVAALETLLCHHGLSTEEAKREALHALDRMKHEVATEIWVNFFDDFIPESPDCLGVEVKCFHVDCERMANPEPLLRQRGVPERVAAQQAQRASFTRQLTEIRLDNDFGSNGLWDAQGRCLRYDLLDLPFPLVKRIAAWQRDYDETMHAPDMGDEAWWGCHEQEAVEIANGLQAALGPKTVVKLYRPQGWVPIDQIVRVPGGDS